MNTKRVIGAMLVAVLVPATFAFADEQGLEKECQRYAVEDGVKTDEMQDYLSDCIADLKEAAKSGGD